MRRTVFFVFLIAFPLLSRCTFDSTESLSGDWNAALNFLPGSKDPFAKLEWKAIGTPAKLSRESGIDTFRYRGWIILQRPLPLDLGQKALEGKLALHIGRVSDAAIIYLDDTIAAKIGNESPYQSGFRHFTGSLPWKGTSPPKVLRIAMLATEQFPATISGLEIQGGSTEDVFAHANYLELISCFFVAIYLSIGCYHMILGLRRLEDLYNIHFGLFALLLAAFYAFQTYTFETVSGNQVLLRERLEETVLFLLGPPLLFFLSDYFYGTLSRFGLLAQLFFTGMVIAVWFSDYRHLMVLRDVWHLMAFAVMVYVMFYIARECYEKKRDAMYMAPGIGLLMLTGIHDIMVARGLLYSIPGTSKFSFLILNAGLAVILANRVIRLQQRVTDLNAHLEQRVESRTIELAAALSDLQNKDKRIQNEMELAREIQLGILPEMPLLWKEFRITARYQSMRKIGGDFYDVQQTRDGKLAILMADVSGHGIPASLITTMTKISFTTALQHSSSPAEVLRAINDEILAHITSHQYLTAALIVISENGDALYASGGHCPAVLIGKSDIRLVSSAGSILGAMREAPVAIEEIPVEIKSGDRLLLYTDGITEARHNRENFGMDRLRQICAEVGQEDGETFLDSVLSAVSRFAQKADPDDDISLLLLEHTAGVPVRNE
jgi:serine phosphatase RsbU (regulator of sigma subunit)